MFTAITIITGSALLLLAVISTLLNPFLRVPRKRSAMPDGTAEGETAAVPLSVIVIADDNAPDLEASLPALLGQDYAAGHQVVVVANEGDSETEDIIKKYKEDSRLKSTFIPKTTRYISREKLGITLGVKAADNQWCVVISSSCRPKDSSWLQEVGKACRDDRNLILGFAGFCHEAKAFQRFSRLRHFAYLWREGTLGKAYSACGAYVALRKDEFILGDGFRGNLDSMYGGYDFIVNKFARKGGTSVLTSPSSQLVQTAPTKKEWHRERTAYLYSCKSLSGGFRHGVWPFLDSLFLHLSWTAAILAAAFAIVSSDWILLGASIASLAILITFRTLIGRRIVKDFDAGVPAWRIMPLELSSIWHTLSDKIRLRRTDRYDLTCHTVRGFVNVSD